MTESTMIRAAGIKKLMDIQELCNAVMAPTCQGGTWADRELAHKILNIIKAK